ncbi:MBL fold metallo-hydrolase [Formosa sp. L2A11]|uniref:MBL fold metallo-hydrolase n=1 Tax=Formosa sp. L2A11 TaxID=2686363 RepID=UPI00131CA60E|nr:MBL fold metallo-hydrolase [Formosa sp. L2A11]
MTRYLILILICLSTPIFAQQDSAHLTATIIGSGSPKFNTERSGPSVLISYQDTRILVDMGNGTQANLNANNTKIKDLDALLFTHHHLDHNEEFTPIFIQALLGGSDVSISGPAPTTTMVHNILTTYKDDINYRLSKSGRNLKTAIKHVTTTNLKGGESFYVGDVKITCTPVHHTITTLAYRFDVNNESIVISGDLTYSETLPILAKNADYLIMDSGGTIKMGAKARPNKKPNNNTATERAHVNLSESSQMAAEAQVKNLILTHFNFTDIDEEATETEIRKNYSGTILFASDLMKIPLTENTSTTNAKTPQKVNSNTPPSFSQLLENMDTNNDQKISKTEAKGRLKSNFETRDKNNDGFLTEDEIKIKH